MKELIAFTSQTGIKDAKVDAIVAGLSSVVYCTNVEFTVAPRQETPKVTLDSIKEAIDSVNRSTVFRTTSFDPVSWFRYVYGVDKGIGNDYSSISFHIPKKNFWQHFKVAYPEFWHMFTLETWDRSFGWDYGEDCFENDEVDSREWRELFESEFGVGDLLSDDDIIPHEE